ncbi:hypothetical protein [Thermoactinomyces daqus]|uniref:hypothetical protein n=1 Tax=Thermoactinomyces daqus TaxID=1329516 RepID=UPI000B20D839
MPDVVTFGEAMGMSAAGKAGALHRVSSLRRGWPGRKPMSPSVCSGWDIVPAG